ncbi:GNAT family N-acetyltransferase [Thermoactinospora rubra]|uniref:GNAT family N-acetyltransferase n=1 Tax=Thermoactinospora rubra TaxID=1088767 RepID=UPI001180C857|nr:GNAT family N-acetyltransferase [Thermoactinospora rubra]
MSFGTEARRVRDTALPHRRRYGALRSAVSRYKPLGFLATWSYITSHAGDVRRDERALVRALEVLEASRTAWHAELAAFARRRAIDKRRRRDVTVEEGRYRHGWRWHGPDAHDAMARTVAALWRQHEAAHVPEADGGIAEIIRGYVERGGRLDPAWAPPLRRWLADRHRLLDGLAYGDLHKMAELIAHDALALIRPGGLGDAEEIARVFLAARAQMTYLPRLHTDEETRWWIREVVIPGSRVWVAEREGRVIGFAALRGSWLDHLYVAPASQAAGVGTALLDRAKRGRRSLDLHVFQHNTGAWRFYERHGFTLVSTGDDNEEGLPDAHLRWARP